MIFLKVKVTAGSNFYRALGEAKVLAEKLNVGIQFTVNGYRHMITPTTDISNRKLTDGFNTQR